MSEKLAHSVSPHGPGPRRHSGAGANAGGTADGPGVNHLVLEGRVVSAPVLRRTMAGPRVSFRFCWNWMPGRSGGGPERQFFMTVFLAPEVAETIERPLRTGDSVLLQSSLLTFEGSAGTRTQIEVTQVFITTPAVSFSKDRLAKLPGHIASFLMGEAQGAGGGAG